MSLWIDPARFPSNVSPDDIRAMAKGLGLNIPDENLSEVTYRYTALMHELNKLRDTDLAPFDPTPTFPIEETNS
jgi:hypothetical protein